MNLYSWDIINWIIPILSFIVTLVTLTTGLKSLKRNNKVKNKVDGPIIIESEIKDSNKINQNNFKFEKESRISFEANKLSEYYSQVLSQSKVSFWFSLIFASIGFTVILLGAFTFVEEKISSSVVTMISGLIIDSISALFFVQSKSAQKSMSDFFEKLRQDRGISDSKEICETISDPTTKDAIKVRLALHLAGIPDTLIRAQEIVDRL